MANWYEAAPAVSEKPKNWFDDAPPERGQGESFVRGAGQGATFGFQDEMAGLGAQSPIPGAAAASQTTLGALSAPDVIAGGIRKLFGGGNYQQVRDEQRTANEQAQKANPGTYLGGAVVGAVASGAPLASLAAAPTIGGQVLRGAAVGAGMGAAQGAGEAPEMSAVPNEAATGGAVGGALGATFPLALQAARRIVSPFPGTPERSRLVDVLRQEGVDLSAGQTSGSRPLQWAEATLTDLPFGGGRAFTERQGEQFTRAALRRAGTDAPRATPEVIDQTLTRMGNEFDRLATGNTITPDRQLVTDLGNAMREYTAVVGPSMQAPAVQNAIQDIVQVARANGGTIPGEFYQATRSRLDRLARNSRADPQLSGALFEIRNSLDSAMERGLAASGSPDLGAWQEVRRQYRNILPIERAATGAGSDTAQGLLSPSQLKNAVAGQNKRAYARGDGDLADLARAGEAVMRPLPNSGTSQRALYTALLGAGGLGAAGMADVDPRVLAGALAGPMVGRAMLTRPTANALANRLLQGNASPQAQALARARIAAPVQQQAVRDYRQSLPAPF